MHKSFIEYDMDIYQEFLDFLKYIYKSRLLQDIFYLCPEFKDFEYPFKNDDILNEMFENTYFVPLESEYGYTQKNLISIFIPANFEDYKEDFLELFIIKLGFLLNTTILEQLKHYISTLLFFNSFRFKEIRHIDSDKDLNNEENYYLKGLMSKEENINKISDKKDGGCKAEILLYGEALEKLTSLQGLKMFYKSTWETSIEKHFSNFKNNYEKEIKNNPSYYSGSSFDLNKVFEDQDICPFLKKILRKFIQHKEINEDKDLMIDLNFYAKKGPELSDNDLQTKINLNYEVYFPRSECTHYSH